MKGPEHLRVRTYVGPRRPDYVEALVVAVPDPPKAAAWYVNALGATLTRDLPRTSEFLPELPGGTHYISFGSPEKSVGLFLVPQGRDLGGGFNDDFVSATGPALGSLTLLSAGAREVASRAATAGTGKPQVVVEEYNDFAARSRRWATNLA